MIAVPPESVSGSEVALSVHYERIRNYTELLAAPLSPEDQTVQSMPDVSPTKWHRAHVTWFFETFVLSAHEKNFKPYQERYWFLFNSYYEQVGPRFSRPLRGVISRPGAHDVGVYRECVDRRVQELLRSPDLDHIGDISSFVKLGLHHEQQHQELLLMDIKHVLSLNPLRPAYGGVWTNELTSGALGWLDYTGGLIEIGNAQGFAFDSELPRHRQFLELYRLADRLTTNGEWMAFIDDGGYGRSELWLSDGWARVNSEGWQAPLYWTRQDGIWLEHSLHGTHPVDPERPVVHVSHYEADAFATWADKRLPTEAEWEHAASLQGLESSISSGGKSLHPTAAGLTTGGSRQLYDSAWQWTRSAYLPYPGFAPAPGAIGEYNGKFMSNQMVLRGGSAFTSPGHTRASYRNFFPPSARWPLTGVRLADNGDS